MGMPGKTAIELGPLWYVPSVVMYSEFMHVLTWLLTLITVVEDKFRFNKYR